MLIYLLTLIDNEGDRQTFTAIYQEYHVQMEKVALRILSEHNDAEDACLLYTSPSPRDA